jgi:1,4-dihydroxy-2-naphthoyl-CoA synthase
VAREILEKSPTAIRFIKNAFTTDGLAGLQQFAGDATLLYYLTEEAPNGGGQAAEAHPPLYVALHVTIEGLCASCRTSRVGAPARPC